MFSGGKGEEERLSWWAIGQADTGGEGRGGGGEGGGGGGREGRRGGRRARGDRWRREKDKRKGRKIFIFLFV